MSRMYCGGHGAYLPCPHCAANRRNAMTVADRLIRQIECDVSIREGDKQTMIDDLVSHGVAIFLQSYPDFEVVAA